MAVITGLEAAARDIAAYAPEQPQNYAVLIPASYIAELRDELEKAGIDWRERCRAWHDKS